MGRGELVEGSQKVQTPSYKINSGNSLLVQWLGLRASTAGAQVPSLVGELRSHKLCGPAKRKKINTY